MEQCPPLPPFTIEKASQKVQLAEDAWNSKGPERVSLAYTVDTMAKPHRLYQRQGSSKGILKGKWEKKFRLQIEKGTMGL